MARKPVEFVALDLPRPISANRLWCPNGVSGMRASKEYESWKQEAGYCLNAQRPGMVEGPYALTIRVTDKWRGDLDNAVKSLSDLLQAHQVIENDRLCQRLLVERASVSGMTVLVASTREAES